MKKSIYNDILKTAAELFYSKGYDATSLADIAKRCGCTKQALSYHFVSKEELGRAVCMQYIRNLSDGFFRIILPEQSKAESSDRLIAGLAYMLWSGAPFYSQDGNAFRFFKEFIYKYPDISTIYSNVCEMYASFSRRLSTDFSDAYISMCSCKALYAALGMLYKYISGQIACSEEEFQYFYFKIFMTDLLQDEASLKELYQKATELIDAHTFCILPEYNVISF